MPQALKLILTVVIILLSIRDASAQNRQQEILKHYDAAQSLMLKGDSYNEAMREYLEFMFALENDSIKFRQQREVALINMANIHFYYHNPSKALEFAIQSYKLSKASGNQIISGQL